eukprot:scaffold44136_cov47-Prasinocladus_malaysianus.AAC.1
MKKSEGEAEVVVKAQVLKLRSRPSTAPPKREQVAHDASAEADGGSLPHEANVAHSMDWQLAARRRAEPYSPVIEIKSKPRPASAFPSVPENDLYSGNVNAPPVN